MSTRPRSEALRRLGAVAAAAFTDLSALRVAASAQGLAEVTIGIVNTSSDAPFFIAEKLGYFREAGIAAKLIAFDGAPKMIAPLGAGQLDVASGAPSAGLFNAIASKIDVRMVADKGSCPPGYGYGPLMIRKDLVTSGKYKSPRDLKGMKFAESAPGSVLSSTIAHLMNAVGLTYNDVQHVYLGFPEQVPAFANGSIDAALTAEPNATIAERQGVAVRVEGNDRWYPGQEQSVVMYGASFLRRRRDVAMRFMTAWIRGARYYNEALREGHLRGPAAKSVIDILVEATPIKDRSVFSDMTSNAVDPNGRLNINSLAEDLAFFKQLGLINGSVIVSDAVDPSFQRAALKQLGPFKPRV